MTSCTKVLLSCLLVLSFLPGFSGVANGMPIIQKDPQLSYVPDASETAIDRSELIRAMAPVDDATFWTIMLVKRKQEQDTLRDFLLSLKKEVSQLIPDWLRHPRPDEESADDPAVLRENAKAINDLALVLESNDVPESGLSDDPGNERGRSRAEAVADPAHAQVATSSELDKVPLSRLFQRNSMPGMFQGGGQFSGAGAGSNRWGSTLAESVGKNGKEKSGARSVSARFESIMQWLNNLFVFLTGFYTYLVLGALLLLYLLIRYLMARP